MHGMWPSPAGAVNLAVFVIRKLLAYLCADQTNIPCQCVACSSAITLPVLSCFNFAPDELVLSCSVLQTFSLTPAPAMHF